MKSYRIAFLAIALMSSSLHATLEEAAALAAANIAKAIAESTGLLTQVAAQAAAAAQQVEAAPAVAEVVAKTTLMGTLWAMKAKLGALYLLLVTRSLWGGFIMRNCDPCRQGALSTWDWFYKNYPEWTTWWYQQGY